VIGNIGQAPNRGGINTRKRTREEAKLSYSVEEVKKGCRPSKRRQVNQDLSQVVEFL
jgi:hypothetical protein